MATIKVKINGEWQQLPVYGFVSIEEAPKDGKQYARQDGGWSEVKNPTQYLDISMFTGETGTLSEEDYQKVTKAYNDETTSFKYMGQFFTGSILNYSGNYTLLLHAANFDIGRGTEIGLTSISVAVGSNKSYQFKELTLSLETGDDGTKALTDNGSYKEFVTPSDLNVKADKITVISGLSGEVTQELQPNVYYEFGECTSLSITLASEISNIYNEYMFEFVSGNEATTLLLPETIKWVNNEVPIIEPNKTYQCSIVNNLALIGIF